MPRASQAAPSLRDARRSSRRSQGAATGADSQNFDVMVNADGRSGETTATCINHVQNSPQFGPTIAFPRGYNDHAFDTTGGNAHEVIRLNGFSDRLAALSDLHPLSPYRRVSRARASNEGAPDGHGGGGKADEDVELAPKTNPVRVCLPSAAAPGGVLIWERAPAECGTETGRPKRWQRTRRR